MATPSPEPLVDTAAIAPTVTDWIGAAAAAATFVVAVIALLYARRQVAEAKAARAQTAALETERSQPYVVMFTELSATTPLLIDLVVRNYGQTSATDVTIQLTPWPKHSPDDGRTDSEEVALPDRIPVLAPGQEWRTSWDHARAREATDLPDRHTGTIRYRGIDGQSRESAVTLDWSLYRSRRWATVRTIHDGAEALRQIRRTLEKWTNSARGGLAVFNRDGDAADALKQAQFEAWKAAQADNDSEQRPPRPRSAE